MLGFLIDGHIYILKIILLGARTVRFKVYKAKNFRLWREGAHPPPVPTPFGRQASQITVNSYQCAYPFIKSQGEH